MPQLHFSVDKETAERLAARARQAGLPLAAFLARMARRESGEVWPEGYLAQVVGSCAGLGLEAPLDPPPKDVVL
jgi:hypothetical protein